MKCDKCSNEATVHEVVIKGGKQHEKHLCEQCAKGDGLPVQTHAPLTSLLTQYITQQTEAAATAATGVNPSAVPGGCAECGLTFAQFRQNGLLGCPRCYEVFEQQLGPLLARWHEGGTHHVGKSPKSMAGAASGVSQATRARRAESGSATGSEQAADARAAQVALLRKQLGEAVAAEQYEKAAKIRDELVRLESMSPGGAFVSPSTPASKDKPARSPKRKGQEGEA